MNGPRIGSYTNATGSVSVACGCAVQTLRRGVVVVVPCDEHAGMMIVEMRPREGAGNVLAYTVFKER